MESRFIEVTERGERLVINVSEIQEVSAHSEVGTLIQFRRGKENFEVYTVEEEIEEMKSLLNFGANAKHKYAVTVDGERFIEFSRNGESVLVKVSEIKLIKPFLCGAKIVYKGFDYLADYGGYVDQEVDECFARLKQA